jgi:hypothetical protein
MIAVVAGGVMGAAFKQERNAAVFLPGRLTCAAAPPMVLCRGWPETLNMEHR